MLTRDHAGRARLWCALAFLLPAVGLAQDPTPGTDLPTDGSGPLRIRIHNFVIAPAAASSPALGLGGGVLLGYQFSHDTAKTAAFVGAAALYSTSNSWTYGIGGRARFQHDRWRVAAGAAEFLLRYDFFGAGTAAGNADTSVRVRQRGSGLILEGTGQIAPGFYFGPRLRRSDFTTSLDRGILFPRLVNLIRLDSQYTISQAGVVARYDTRDDKSYPTKGTWGETWGMFPGGWLGSNRAFQSYAVAVNQYFPIGHDRVVALRFAGCGRADEVPVWELCEFGSGPDLRGYLAGRYRDRAMFATQGEFRTPVWRRIGAVAFAGVGGVAPSIDDFSGSDLLAGGGVGVRYLVSASSKLHVGVDGAWGKKESGFYLRIGEAF